MRLALGWTLAWATMLAPRPLLAEPTSATAPPSESGAEPQPDPRDEQIERAMAAYQRGTQSYNLAQYEVALADFTEAASLYASPDFQYNIGLCYEKLGEYDAAIRAFAAYLRAKPDAEDRADVENRIHTLEQELRARERKTAEDRAASDRAAQAKAAEEAAQPRPPIEPTLDEPPAPPGDDGRPLIIAGAALGGVGVAAALAGGIALGVLARQRSTAVDEVQTGGNPDALTFDQTQALAREGKRFEAIQIGLVAGGAAVAVTGAVLLALGLRKQQAVRAQAWRVGPLYTRGFATAGLVLTGRF
jgi:tetratricopeptide (TPR) repeat protein